MIDDSLIEIDITIAISESGETRCCINNQYNVQERDKHSQFMDELRQENRLWQCKTIRVRIPMPHSFEDMGVAK